MSDKALYRKIFADEKPPRESLLWVIFNPATDSVQAMQGYSIDAEYNEPTNPPSSIFVCAHSPNNFEKYLVSRVPGWLSG